MSWNRISSLSRSRATQEDPLSRVTTKKFYIVFYLLVNLDLLDGKDVRQLIMAFNLNNIFATSPLVRRQTLFVKSIKPSPVRQEILEKIVQEKEKTING